MAFTGLKEIWWYSWIYFWIFSNPILRCKCVCFFYLFIVKSQSCHFPISLDKIDRFHIVWNVREPKSYVMLSWFRHPELFTYFYPFRSFYWITYIGNRIYEWCYAVYFNPPVGFILKTYVKKRRLIVPLNRFHIENRCCPIFIIRIFYCYNFWCQWSYNA